MKWHDLIFDIATLSHGGTGNPDITAVTSDSRMVTPGSLYVSIPGFKVHGDSFIKQAVDKGACAVISHNKQDACSVVWAQVQDVRKWVGLLSRRCFEIDVSSMVLVGITGTNGKTTVAHLFRTLLAQKFELDKVWMFGTISYVTGEGIEPAKNTTPEAAHIFKSIHDTTQKPQAIVMEVSSHSLALDRVAGLEYDCAVYTNLTQDHLDFHGSMEDYYLAKKKLFTNYIKANGKAVVNIDDSYGKRLAEELKSNSVITFGRDLGASIRILDSKCAWDSTTIVLNVCGEEKTFTSKLAGQFNVYNMTTLVAGAYALGISMETVSLCFDAVVTVPGRMERVFLSTAFSVFVDYAHTPDALENVLVTARKLTRGRVICVFGCGGDRDRTKRPLMAEAVSHYADEGIITSDNPRSEDPKAIIGEILKGIPLDFPSSVEIDRKEAIRKAMLAARAGDCVIIAGKGHEDYQEIKGVRHHFDDREEVVAACKALGIHHD